MHRFKSLSALTATWVLVACSSGADGGPANEGPADPEPPVKSFELTLSASKLPVLKGTSEAITVTLTRSEGFTDDVVLTEVGLPPGTKANAFTFSGDVTETTLTIDAAATAPFSLPTSVRVEGTAGELTDSEALTVTVYGKPGELDTTFAGGSVVIPVGASDDYAYATAVQADGKVLVAGRSAENLGDFALVRLERDGSLDTAFGQGGKVTTPIGERDETAYAVALQADGKIVLAGTTTSAATGKDFAVVRYEANGALDAGFGDGGKVVVSFSDDADTGYALMIQQDRKIVVGGDANLGASGTGLDFALARLEPDGALDETFGDGGKVTASIASNGARDSVYALAAHQVGGETRIVAAGGEGDFTIARFRASGALDASFGDGGKISGVNGSTIGAARDVKIQNDGKIVVAGHSQHDFAVARFEQSGSLDGSFGEGGTAITKVSDSNWDEAQGIALESTGKIVVGGWVYEGGGTNGNFALVRYGTDGVLDPSFGTAGVVVTDVTQKSKPDEAAAVLLQSDERVPIVRVVLAGSASGSNRDFAISRYFR